MKIKNPNYRKFLDEGEIDIITPAQFQKALDNVTGDHRRQGRALLILLHLSGCRPKEVLMMTAGSIDKEGSYIMAKIPATKKGLPRVVYFQDSNKHAKELYEYSCSLPPNLLMFPNFRDEYVREYRDKNGTLKTRTEITAKLRYYVTKWFTGVVDHSIPPYFLRHSRFSDLTIKGVSDRDIMQLKGSRTLESTRQYQHMSSKSAKRTAKLIK